MNSPDETETPGTAGSTRSADGAGERSADHAGRIAQAEKDQPLRRRILQLLSTAPTTTKGLADQLGVRPESASRKVSKLRDEGLVASRQAPDDGREWLHDLTVAGEVELSRHLAYGVKPQPVHPSRAEALEFLRSALAAAVEMRRNSNELEDAEARLQVVLREARKLGEGELVVDALSELSITQRQNHRAEAADDLLTELEVIASGKSMYVGGSTLVRPALAHRQYGLGRAKANTVDDLDRAEDHLISAESLFEELAAAPQNHLWKQWTERKAWSIAGRANNLRTQAKFDEALEKTAAALRVFEELGDPYGRSYCLFQFGFCLRLLGEFNSAWTWLSEAQALAAEHSFERFQADSLMQIGEVLRCQGELDEGQAALEEARDRSVVLGLGVTQAFAHSALGAVAFHRREFAQAQMELWRAQKGFELHEHRKGMALNAQRLAAVSRLLSYQERKDKLEDVEKRIALALGHYMELHSPAGVTACEIERGRLRIMCDGEAPQTIDTLLHFLETRSARRDLLELDPWVPRELEAFAEETQDANLVDRARRFLVDAEQSLGERARKYVRRAMAIVGRGGEKAAAPPARAPGPDPMGGESRQLDPIEFDVAEPAAV